MYVVKYTSIINPRAKNFGLNMISTLYIPTYSKGPRSWTGLCIIILNLYRFFSFSNSKRIRKWLGPRGPYGPRGPRGPRGFLAQLRYQLSQSIDGPGHAGVFQGSGYHETYLHRGFHLVPICSGILPD